MTTRLTPPVRLALAVFAFVMMEALLIAFVDRPLSHSLRTADANHKAVIDFFRAWTNLGKSTWYLWVSGIGTILCFALSYGRQFPAARRKALHKTGRAFGFFFTCVAVSGLLSDLVKPLIGRARPVLLDRDGYYGFDPFTFHAAHNSLPSGHATTAFAVAFALIALFPRARVWLMAFAVAIAVSRVMVNAHYVSDVVAGAVLGVLTVMVVEKIFRRRGWMAAFNGSFPTG